MSLGARENFVLVLILKPLTLGPVLSDSLRQNRIKTIGLIAN